MNYFRHVFSPWALRFLVLFNIAITLLLANSSLVQSAQSQSDETQATLPIGTLIPSKRIPDCKTVLGFDWGEEIPNHHQIESYFRALAAAADQKCQLVEYGKSYEGRTLYYLVITSPSNLKQLDQIRQNNLKLSDPRVINTDRSLLAKSTRPSS